MWIECPECRAKLEVPADHPTRPFCSTRCKLLDLGRWFGEEVRIAGQPKPAGFTEGPVASVDPELMTDLSKVQIHET